MVQIRAREVDICFEEHRDKGDIIIKVPVIYYDVHYEKDRKVYTRKETGRNEIYSENNDLNGAIVRPRIEHELRNNSAKRRVLLSGFETSPIHEKIIVCATRINAETLLFGEKRNNKHPVLPMKKSTMEKILKGKQERINFIYHLTHAPEESFGDSLDLLFKILPEKSSNVNYVTMHVGRDMRSKLMEYFKGEQMYKEKDTKFATRVGKGSYETHPANLIWVYKGKLRMRITPEEEATGASIYFDLARVNEDDKDNYRLIKYPLVTVSNTN